MKALFDIANNAISLKPKHILVKVYEDELIQEFIIDLNRIDQLFKKGERTDGSTLGKYSEFSEALSEGEVFGFGGDSGTKRKTTSEHIFLLDEGDFYRSFDVKISKTGSFKIEANDIKEDKKLSEVYGQEILGLSGDSKTKLAQEILSEVIEEVRKEMFK